MMVLRAHPTIPSNITPKQAFEYDTGGCLYYYHSLMYHSKVLPTNVHIISLGGQIQCPLLYSLLLRSNVDTPLPKTSHFKDDLCWTPSDESSNVLVTSLIDVNIFDTKNIPNT